MVSFAREHNAHPKLAYEQLDITGDVSQLLEKYGPFDRLYVFNSLNRVKDQAAAWRNMQKLLKPGGECLLFYCAWYMTPDIWRALAKKDRWSRFAETSGTSRDKCAAATALSVKATSGGLVYELRLAQSHLLETSV
ncbi:hypothetical protein HPB51_011528 [Rhipicephalus microplus]|uniref:Methyltransferase type 11 domain-containing protein n=1 Tax=Rhipicephalus microplus TaxID=6941 RepID=A0A9J6E9F1_RHIMP|nr:hypothetical protein HPB51_011528 [Rhipicephalus microplus]